MAVVHERSDAAGRRRWLIGVAISVTFGILGVVMSVLHYLRDDGSAPGTNMPAAAPATPDAPKERGRGRGH